MADNGGAEKIRRKRYEKELKKLQVELCALPAPSDREKAQPYLQRYIESCRRWYDYSLARDLMLEHTDTADTPWYIVDSNDKRRARLNVISHILGQIPYRKIDRPRAKLPKRSEKRKYDDGASLMKYRFVAARY